MRTVIAELCLISLLVSHAAAALSRCVRPPCVVHRNSLLRDNDVFCCFNFKSAFPGDHSLTFIFIFLYRLAAVFTFEVWDRRSGEDVLIGKARVPLCSLRACHGYHLSTSSAGS